MKPQESEVRSQRPEVNPRGTSLAPEIDDPRMVRAVQEYLDAMEAGQRPNRREFLARHPEIAGPLAECIEALEFVHAVGPHLDQPAPPKSLPSSSPPAMVDLAMPLGDFRILREIGRGGMGVVYEAEQLSLGRRIALKVLPFALTLDSRQLQRFKNEARAAAQLHHSNIVPIYSVGCERGVHFYAMQYIEGQTLAEVIEELKHLTPPGAGRQADLNEPTGPYLPTTPPLSNEPPADKKETTGHGLRMTLATDRSTRSPVFFRSVAVLGIQVAEALEHAHQMGVIHRDVKPANLLVDVCSHLWVTDFGLAQFQSDAALTLSGDLLGTLRYMSPEQALAKRGLVDHRTDVYSLGVTLYELLTLEPVFDGRDREELLRQIAFEDPRPPRRINKAIPVDLETIILKAMAKRVEDRYTTAQELADDLRRFLEQKPIQARRPTLLERAGKWSRRHRAVVACAVGMLILTALGFAASTFLIAREQRNTQAAYNQLAAEQVRTKAAYEAEVRNVEQARQILDFITQISEEELAGKPGVQEVRHKLLNAALLYYDDFITHCPNNPSTQEKLVASHLRVARLLAQLGAPEDAEAALQEARRILNNNTPPATPRPPAVSLNQVVLLQQPSLQVELKLSEESKKQIFRLSMRRDAVFRDSQGLSAEALYAKFAELAAEEKALLEGLRPDQAQRLKQIARQHSGISAFADPEVADALTLSEEQKERIRSIQDDARRNAMRILMHRQGGPPRQEDWKKAEDTWKNARDQALNLLSEAQKAKWKELTGEPFKGDVRLPYPGSFGLRPSPFGPK